MQREYGVTPQGFNKKRLDIIMKEFHADLTEGWGVDTAINPQSLLNVIVTHCSNAFAELWETGEAAYFAMYPSSASGISLDRAMEYGGVGRKGDVPTYYYLLCTGDDGTVIPEGTTVQSNTKPPVNLILAADSPITRKSFNRVTIRVVALQPNTTYIVGINDNTYRITTGNTPVTQDILEALAEEINDPEYTITVEAGSLSIVDQNVLRVAPLLLSDNLTTVKVSSLAYFGTEEMGVMDLPEGSITQIVKTHPGFDSCINLSPPIYGSLRQSDIEARQSYIARSAARSDYMIVSIESALQNEVQGVLNARGYENTGDTIDGEGRPPHCIEMVVDGGGDIEVARIIFREKTGGIQTFGDQLVYVPDKYGYPVPIRFNRPQKVYCWFRVTLTPDLQELPTKYAELTKASMVEQGAGLELGENVIVQSFLSGIYINVPGTRYVKIDAFATLDLNLTPTPEQYREQNIELAARQKAEIAETRIEVILA